MILAELVYLLESVILARLAAGSGGRSVRTQTVAPHHVAQKTDENMAKEEDVCELEEVSDEPKGKKVAKHDAGAADLEKVTDYVEEAEISSQNISDVSIL